ncbi:hypothetical protein J4Q44_G00015820 [Coregonus suidteri]|uniref:Centrosomal protein of 192 kDa n=1 Tax=Coregonus suidteri TaxID=861788 RepID=A0AAN8R6J6_9TELE
MTESFRNIEDEAFPSFLSTSVGSGRATLGDVTLASTLGLPVAASTVAKIRAGADNRVNSIQASYVENGRLSLANSQSNEEQGKFALSFTDDLDDADDFIAAHRFSDMLVKVNLDETEPRTRASSLGPNTQTGPLPGRHSEHGDDLSTGLLTFTHLGNGDVMDLKVQSLQGSVEDQSLASEGADSDHFSGSVSSFLANEKLMSVDSMNSDVTDDDMDVNDLQDEELDLYFNKLVSPAMQRGRVEGQEIPVADQPANQDYSSQPSSTEPQKNRYQFLDDYDQDFQMPDVRLAATGMDSCPGSDEEDTEDELEAARRHSSSTRHRLLLPSTTRQLVGESNRPSFRPGLEGGSSDEEAYSGRNPPPLTGIEHRHSAEGQVINTVTGGGGGGDGSSGSEEGGNDGVSSLPLSTSSAQTTYDVLRGLGILGGSVMGENAQDPHSLLGLSRGSLMGDRVGPVGTGENSSGSQRMSPVNWSMSLDRQEALDAMDSTESAVAGEGQGVLDSIYLRTGAGHWRPQDMTNTSHLQTTQSSFHLSQVLPPHCDEEEEEEEEEGRPAALGLRRGPCGDSSAPPGPPGLSDRSQGEEGPLSTSLEAKYLSQSFHQEDSSHSDSDWNHCRDNLEIQSASHSGVVYQNEEGKWVTDLAYYSSFEKEVDGNQLSEEVADLFQGEDFVPGASPRLSAITTAAATDQFPNLMLSISHHCLGHGRALHLRITPSQLAAMIMALCPQRSSVKSKHQKEREARVYQHDASTQGRYLLFLWPLLLLLRARSQVYAGDDIQCSCQKWSQAQLQLTRQRFGLRHSLMQHDREDQKQSQLTFRPSTSPLTHSCPIHRPPSPPRRVHYYTARLVFAPTLQKTPQLDLTPPHSQLCPSLSVSCFQSPSLQHTEHNVSLNYSTSSQPAPASQTPDRHKEYVTIGADAATIIRASPTPPVDRADTQKSYRSATLPPSASTDVLCPPRGLSSPSLSPVQEHSLSSTLYSPRHLGRPAEWVPVWAVHGSQEGVRSNPLGRDQASACLLAEDLCYMPISSGQAPGPPGWTSDSQGSSTLLTGRSPLQTPSCCRSKKPGIRWSSTPGSRTATMAPAGNEPYGHAVSSGFRTHVLTPRPPWALSTPLSRSAARSSITVTSLAIDGEKLDSFPVQWLIVKNKTIIGPKSHGGADRCCSIPPQGRAVSSCPQCLSSSCLPPLRLRRVARAEAVRQYGGSSSPWQRTLLWMIRRIQRAFIGLGSLPRAAGNTKPVQVITVPMKVNPIDEQTLCQSANALLATVCLFCGDEVSRQQFRRLLLSKPEAGRKILSENSLLKGLNFNERFLGEEQVLEAYDLPQSPNQAQLFYGNLSKVVLSVLGSTETLDSGESDHQVHVQPPLAVTRRGSEADSGFGNSDRHISNVSLDVLPVKGPQGPALPRTEASRTGTEPGDHRDSWSLQPEQLVLTSPTINGVAETRHVQIQNHSSSRELSFELSWPAHCLTVTPQHGVIEPQCHLQILISPNPSLATRSSTLPWSGQIYVQCDSQQKFIRIQIRQDLALDVSTAPADRSLAPLPPQTATPMPTTMLPPAGRPPQTLTRAAPATVEISNRTIMFPATPSGDTSESSVEVENRGEQVRWYLSSFAPPYVKGVDSSGDVYRATYTAFRCPRVSGTLGAHDKMQVPITFLPRDRGDYAQFWDLECHPVAEPQHKTRIRFQLCGTGVKVGPVEAPQEADCSLVKTDATFKTRMRPDPVVAAAGGRTGQEEALGRGVYAPQVLYSFPPTRVGETSTLKVNMRNNSFDTHGLRFLSPREPFHIKHSKYSLRSQRYIHLPVQFKPVVTGNHSSLLLVQMDTSGSLTIQLTGEALP